MQQTELVELEALAGYRIARGDPDPRGWAVVACNGECVGTIHTLLIDPVYGKARYLVGQVNRSQCRVLLPVGLARLDQRRKRVIFDVSTAAALASLPEYNGTMPTEVDCDCIQRILVGTQLARPNPDASVDRRRRERRGSSGQ